nr:MAG TPA: hypothetical protein [Caudoviricetes sp.]
MPPTACPSPPGAGRTAPPGQEGRAALRPAALAAQAQQQATLGPWSATAAPR